MGQCENKNAEQRINILHINSSQLISDAQMEVDVFKYPKHQFDLRENKEIVEKQVQRRRRYLRFTVDQVEYVELSYPVYQYLSSSLNAELGAFEISQVFMDQINMNKALYLIKRNNKMYSLLIRTFSSYQDQKFYQIANEIYITKKITLLNSSNLHKINHSYIIQPTAQPISSHVQLIFMEPVTTSLSFIIKKRKTKQILWNLRQFVEMMKDLVEAVSFLHKNWLSHNDIRPSNIYYSKQTNAYLLSSFSCVKSITQGFSTSRTKSKMNFHQDDKISKDSLTYGSIQHQLHKDFFSPDVFGLGMTLLSAFYLCQNIDRKKSAPFIRQFVQQYPILHIIKGMITSLDQKLTISEVKTKLQQYQKSISQKSLSQIDSPLKMTHQQIYQIEHFDKQKRAIAIAEGYKTLGIIKSWKQKLNDRHLHQKIARKSIQSAKHFSQLGIISNMQGNSQKFKSYFIHSAQIYHQLGTKCLKERDYHKASSYFQSSVDCLNKIKLQQSNIIHIRMSLSLQQAKTISGLQIVSYSSFEELRRLFFSLKNVSLSIEFTCIEQFISIYDYFQNYNQVDKLLQLFLKKLGLNCPPSDYFHFYNQIIQNNIKRIALLNRTNQQQARYLLNCTQKDIIKLMDQFEYYLLQNPLKKMHVHFNYSRLNLLKKIPIYEPKLEQIESQIIDWITHFRQINQHPTQSQFHLLHAQVLEFMGDQIVQKNQLQKIHYCYRYAFQQYRTFFGTYYNIECALVAEKLASLYRRFKKEEEEEQFTFIFRKILYSTYGPFHKDKIRLGLEKEISSRSQITPVKREPQLKFEEIYFKSFHQNKEFQSKE